MKTLQLALFCFIWVVKSYGQTVTKSYGRIEVEITKEKRPKKIYTKVEIKSAFRGGDSSWVQSLEKDLNRSIQIGKKVKKGKYIVSVQFVLDKEGSLADIRCVNNPGPGMCEEVMRVLKKRTMWRSPGSFPVRPYSRSSTTY